MKITLSKKSKIGNVDFENLEFGKIFTDHIFVSKYSKGQWSEGEIMPYGNFMISPSARVFHYGQAIFEGMKCFKSEKNSLILFRPDENFKRLNRSAHRLQIPEFPEDYFFEGLQKLISLESEWIKKGVGNSLYVRPFVFASQATVQAIASLEYTFLIICSPAKSYYDGGKINVLVAENYSRAANGGVGFAKAAGNYAAQFYPTSEATKKGFQQIIWTDSEKHKYLEEAGTMNIFFKINGKLITSPLNDRILDGVTRKSIITIAKDKGIGVEERLLSIDEVVEAHKTGKLEEIFGTGTAVVVLPISSFSYKDVSYSLPQKADLAENLRKELQAIQYNQIQDPYDWTVKVD